MLWVLLVLLVLDTFLILGSYGAAERSRRELETVKRDLWALRVSVASPSAGGGAEEAYASAVEALPGLEGTATELDQWRARFPNTATELDRFRTRRQAGGVSTASVVHLCPESGVYVTRCCGRPPLELPGQDMLTLDKAKVSCPSWDPTTG
ncbi:MAG: hypothetical protein ACOH1W_07895 [Tessaracoccus sp.]